LKEQKKLNEMKEVVFAGISKIKSHKLYFLLSLIGSSSGGMTIFHSIDKLRDLLSKQTRVVGIAGTF
jgi:hypothetical protein